MRVNVCVTKLNERLMRKSYAIAFLDDSDGLTRTEVEA